MLKNGTVIDGKYKILEKIGRGGMSCVYLAINEKANKRWAIKEIRRNRHYDISIVKQSLEAETNMLKKLSHKNLPSIVDIVENDNSFLVVMDYIEGTTLENLVKEKGAQKQEDVVNWAIQLCDVLQYLHSRTPAVVYRDMKPSNIMLKNDGSVVLIDFGTAREYKNNSSRDTTHLGTRGYAAPEQFGGKGQTDARTDIYCLGATLYHLLTGHTPTEPPYERYPITILNNTLSKGLETIITKCTQNNPDERYQSAHELKEALEKYKEIGTPKLKSYKKILTLFAVDTTLTLSCAGASAGLEHEHMELCAKIFSGYATILLALGISMYFMFDIKGVVMVLKNKKTSQTATCKVQNSEPLKNDKRTVQLPQALAVVMLLVFTTGIFSTKSYAAQTRIIINDTDENPDNIQIIEMIPDDIVNETDEHDYIIYVFNISHPANEYPSNELQIIDTDENPVPKSDTIPNTNTQNNSPMLTIILASVMACVILIMISMVVRLYIVTTKEKRDA